MCRHYFKVLEISHRRGKRIGLVGKIGYVAKKRPRNDGTGNAGAKRSRVGEFLRCSDPPPARRGRRNYACRVCGYAIASKATTTWSMECCDQRIHAACFEASAELSQAESKTTEKCCSKLRHFLNKDRSVILSVAPATSRSPLATQTQPAPCSTPKKRGVRGTISQQDTGPAPVPCEYCNEPIPMSNNRHYLYECRAISGIYDPGGGVDYSRLTPLARRAAGMTRLQRKSDGQIKGPK